MNPIEVYQTSDFKIHMNEDVAVKHQIDLLGEVLDGFLPHDDRGNVTQNDRFNILIKQMSDKNLFEKVENLHFIVSYMKEQNIKVEEVSKEAKKS